MRWKISPQWTTHRQNCADTDAPLFFFCLVFVSFCFNQGHSTVSWKKTKGTTNAHQAQKCQDKRKIEGKKSLRKLFKTVLKKNQFRQASPSKTGLYVGKSMNHGICSKVTFCTDIPKITEWNISESAKTGDEFCFLFFFPICNTANLLVLSKSRQIGNQGYYWNLGSYCWWSSAYVTK